MKVSLTSVPEIIHLGTPSLVFSSLASEPFYSGDIMVLSGSVLLIFTGAGLLIRVYSFSHRI